MGLQPQEGLDLLSLVHSLAVGKGGNPILCPITACLHCLLSLFPFKIYSMGKTASLGIGISNSHVQMLLLPTDVFPQHFCGYVYCLRR